MLIKNINMQQEYIYYPRIFMKIYGLKRQEI